MKMTITAALLAVLALSSVAVPALSAKPAHVRKAPAAPPQVIVLMDGGNLRPDTRSRDNSRVKMEIIDADVSNALVGPVTDAVTDRDNAKARLETLAQTAPAKGEDCTITRRTAIFVGGMPLTLPVSNSLFTYPPDLHKGATVRRRLTVDMAPHVNPNNTVTVHFHLWKRQTATASKSFPRSAAAAVWGQDHVVSFHSGEMKAFAIRYPGTDTQHLVFATVTVLPQDGS